MKETTFFKGIFYLIIFIIYVTLFWYIPYLRSPWAFLQCVAFVHAWMVAALLLVVFIVLVADRAFSQDEEESE